MLPERATRADGMARIKALSRSMSAVSRSSKGASVAGAGGGGMGAEKACWAFGNNMRTSVLLLLR